MEPHFSQHISGKPRLGQQRFVHHSLHDLITYPKEGIFTYVLEKEAGLNYSLICLRAGQAIELHYSTGNVALYIIEGIGELELTHDENLSPEQVKLAAPYFLFIPANLPQRVQSVSNLALIHSLTH